MNKLHKYISWEWILLPFLITGFQYCVKVIASQMVQEPIISMAWLERLLKMPFTAVAVLSEALAFILWMRVLAVTDISRALPLTAISYILIILTSWIVFDEPLLVPQIVGSALILSGVWVLKSS